LELVKLLPDSKQLEWDDPWNIAEYRSNALVTMKLQDIQSEKCFAVGNYHMPCCFYAPQVMTLHVDLAARHIQKLAAQSSMPYILAGDFNITPDSSQYRLMTTGQMDKGDPEWPSPRHGTTWEPTAKPMASAYRLAEGKEPNFTNYARVGEQEPFIDTLDYIFLSKDTETNENVKSKWKVKGVQSLPHRDEAGGPFPNLDHGEPSDHILIAADLELK
jgi:2',5'-phosphodiesterase